ncbi:MAG: hypothetical protein OXD31_11130 [Chloroflexi bacterium]|nr:hypothetical protein [Chloroflexota bacterium]
MYGNRAAAVHLEMAVLMIFACTPDVTAAIGGTLLSISECALRHTIRRAQLRMLWHRAPTVTVKLSPSKPLNAPTPDARFNGMVRPAARMPG